MTGPEPDRSGALVVIGFDGSPDAERAIEVAAATTRARGAVVVHVWDPAVGAEGGVPWGTAAATPVVDPSTLEARAQEVAQAGAMFARTAGLPAEPEARAGSGAGGVAEALLNCAAERDADLIVVGRRGMSRVKEVLLGSVSSAVVRDGASPVLIVPGVDAS